VNQFEFFFAIEVIVVELEEPFGGVNKLDLHLLELTHTDLFDILLDFY